MAPPRNGPVNASRKDAKRKSPSSDRSGPSLKSTGVSKPTDSTLVMAADGQEVEFPRGTTSENTSKREANGAGNLRNAGKRTRDNDGPTDDLFVEDGAGEDDGSEAKKSAKRMKTKNGESKAVKPGRKAGGKNAESDSRGAKLKPNALSASHLPTGLRVLGVVKEISDIDVVVSLPNNITAFLPITNVSEMVSRKAEEVANALEKDAESDSGDSDVSNDTKGDDTMVDKDGSDNDSNNPDEDSETDLDKMEVDSSDDETEEPTLPNLRNLFHIGQLLACRVTEVETSNKKTGGANAPSGSTKQTKRVEITVDPRIVNEGVEALEGMILACVVHSQEDTGVLLEPSLGSFRSAFCPMSLARSYMSYVNEQRGLPVDTELEPGQVALCVVQSVDLDRGLLNVALDRPLLSSALLGMAGGKKMKSDSKKKDKPPSITFDSLTPLSSCKVVVTRHIRDGTGAIAAVGVKLGEIDGVIGGVHLGLGGNGSDGWDDEVAKEFPVNAAINVRVLHSDPTLRRISFTRRGALLSLTEKPLSVPPAKSSKNGDSLDVGSFVTVRSVVVDKYGILGKVAAVGGEATAGSSESWGYIHISRLSDAHTPPTIHTDSRYATGTLHKARIVGVDLCDGVWQCSAQKSILETKFLRISDIAVGSVVKGTVLKHGSFGMVVKLTDTITGVVPAAHLSDIRLKNPEKLHKVGSNVKCRVVTVDVTAKKVQLSCRKSLVAMAFPPLTAYSEAQPGSIHLGVVTAVKEFGCLVTFFGGVRCLVPLQELSDGFVEKPSDVASVGKVVKCRVLTVDPAQEKLRCSFKMSERSGTVKGTVEVGQLVDGRVVSATAEGVLVQLLSSDQDTSAPTKAFIPPFHLSDFPSLIQKWSDKLRDGALMKNLIVTSKDEKKGRIVASNKSLLREYGQRNILPVGFEDFEVGRLVPGWIKNSTDLGVFVGFVGGQVGLARKHDLADLFVTEPKEFFQIGQTVLARVVEVDQTQKRFFVTLKTSTCLDTEDRFPLASLEKNTLDEGFGMFYMIQLFEEKDALELGKLTSEGFAADPESKWKESFRIGHEMEGTVKQVMPYGVIVKATITEKVSGLIPGDLLKGKRPKPGDSLQCVVLDLDGGKKILDLSPKDTSNVLAEKKMAPEFNRVYDAVVEVVKHDYCVLRVPGLGNQVVFAPTRNFNSGAGVSTKYRASQTVRVKFVSPFWEQSSLSEGRILCLTVAEKLKKPTAPSEKSADLRRHLKDPLDAKLQSLEDFKLGITTRARVKSVKSTQVNLTLAENLNGRVHCTEVYDSFADVKDKKHPLSRFKIGDEIECKVVGILNSKNHKYLPISHRNPASQSMVEMTVRPADLAAPIGELDEDRPKINHVDIPVGQKMLGFIQRVESDALWVHVSPAVLARVAPLEASEQLEVVRDLAKHFAPGMAVNCWAIQKDDGKGTVDLSLRENPGIITGSVTVGRVLSVDENKAVNVILGGGKKLFGRAFVTDLSDRFESNPTKKYSVGAYVACRILSVTERDGRTFADVSLRPSQILKKVSEKVEDPEFDSVASLSVGAVVRGYVKNVTDSGCFVSLGRNLSGRVKIKEMSDDYVKDWKGLVKIGQLVRAEVIGIDTDRNQVELTLKQSVVNPEGYKKAKKKLDWEGLTKGMKLDGTVRKVESFGVFINIVGATISGLCHISEVSDKPIKDLTSLYSVGDPVKVIVLKVNREGKRLSLGLKPSYFDADDFEPTTKGDLSEDMSGQEEAQSSSEFIKHVTNIDVEMEDTESPRGPAGKPQGMSVKATWDPESALAVIGPGATNDADDSEDEDDEKDPDETPKSRKQRLKEKKEEERQIDEREKALLDPSSVPQVAADFERLLLGSPNDSFLWIKYMAFHMQMAEVEHARQTAERALRTINYRDEEEKLNVWIAFMNLENAFGTPETLQAVFDRAVQYNEPLKVYKQLVQIYEKSGKPDLVESTYQVMVKKFNTNPKVWQSFGQFYLQQSEGEKARELLQRSLKSLPKRDHVDNIAAFGQLEFKFGDPERGRTIFEGVLGNYPKRVDLWSVYLDMEISRVGDVPTIRRLFERVIHIKFSSKKMKFLFTRYLDFEKKHGTEETVQHVKDEAMRYVESIAPNAAGGGQDEDGSDEEA
ncbi:nucleic acid-binding protein [Gonapodya prolifera JEL478]|uniref:Nucleic acid-binding protein n=1 Tax=Gonapodya prolifera (strain JEL478) TaxID=1344416 RepID=A0A139AYG6_GONPJ|nr:nucleic acid-binding protein [Gonapodya prolifera JEL478]|eukprot:KXS21740.1 nucleic acid-binding protein [Gonapodya prolifera JEL478]